MLFQYARYLPRRGSVDTGAMRGMFNDVAIGASALVPVLLRGPIKATIPCSSCWQAAIKLDIGRHSKCISISTTNRRSVMILLSAIVV